MKLPTSGARVRLSKDDVLGVFARQEKAFRVAILASHWLSAPTEYAPSAIKEARSLSMEVLGRQVSFSDLADDMERQPFMLAGILVENQLHASIRAPFEALKTYCSILDHANNSSHYKTQLRAASWYIYAKAIRDAVSHNFHYHFDERFMRLLPHTWNGITIARELNGRPVDCKTFSANIAYQLLVEMQTFAAGLPDRRT